MTQQTLAILGASSQLARDLIRSMTAAGREGLLLYVRDLPTTLDWLRTYGLEQACTAFPYEAYDELPHDAVLNFVGVGDPRRAAEMGPAIFDITHRFDELALAGLVSQPERRYLFLSSGAIYGNAFHEPVTDRTAASIPVNAITSQDWYTVAKLHAEARHRARAHMPIVDLRVFNYFSRTQDLAARFFITDVLRAIRQGETLQVSADYIVRDFLHPRDFHQLVENVLAAEPANAAIDCYTSAPVDKPTLLSAMQEHFGLRYEIASVSTSVTVNATGTKPYYYSLNRKAIEFGYAPRLSSLEGVLTETAAILG